MAEPPNLDPHLLEAMEACRPKSDDVEEPALAFLAEALAADPELAELFERLQRVDAGLAEAFRDVPLPDGLADRIAARLASARNGQKPSGAAPSAEYTPIEESGAQATKRPPRVRRRWILAGTVAAALAASLIVALVVRSPQPPPLDRQSIVDGARAFSGLDQGAPGEFVAQNPPPTEYPPDSDFDVRRFPRIQWRPIRGLLGRNGVAYDLGNPRTPRATLYVLPCPGTVTSLPNAVPRKPDSTTGGLAIGAWQKNGLLYVLVVEGDAGAYQDLLPRTTFA